MNPQDSALEEFVRKELAKEFAEPSDETEDEEIEDAEPDISEPKIETIEISPLIMLARTLEGLDTMRDWAEDTKNGELMGQAVAGYLEIHDRLLMLEEEQEDADKSQHFGFQKLQGGKYA